MKHKAALWAFTVGLLVLFAGADGFSQNYPLPQPSDQTPPATYAGLPAVGFSPPIKRFVGRFLDSQGSGDKTVPVRTYRNRSAGVYLEGDRIFVSMSAVFGAYKASTFFTQELGRGLDVKTWGASLPFAFSVDPEARNSGWLVDPIHAQDTMSGAVDGEGFDWDDRGNVVIGYKAWGWGIVDASGRLIKQVKNGPVNSKILIARGASGYYVFSASALALTGTEVFNVTTPATPALLRKLNLTFTSAAKSSMAPNAPVALLNGSLSIFTPDALAAGGPALQVFAGPYRKVTSDGTNFYAVRQTPTSSISKISPSSTGYVETTYPIAGSFQPSGVRYGAGYLTVSGSDMDEGRFGYSLRLYRLEAGVPKEIDLKNFIMRYYGTPPPGYTKPESYTFPFEGHVVRYQGKDYLLIAAGGLGDVYELESGPAIPVAPDPEITVSGCVYAGDPCTLTAGSKSGASTTAWTYSWTVDGITSGTVKSITLVQPTVAKTYAVSVSATNTVGTTSAAKGVPVLPVPVCDVVPSGVTIQSSCGTTCSKDTPITFKALATTYALKPCDTYAWSFPDLTTGTGPTITKTFAQVGPVTATLVVRNVMGAQASPATLTVDIVAMACPPPDNNLAADFSGTSSGCYAGGGVNCAVGETINFSITTFSNVGTSTCHLITWTFPDGTDTTRAPSRAFSAAGTYTVTLNAAVSGGASRTVSVVVPVGASAQPSPPPPPSGCTVPSVYVDFTGNQGCSAINANCKVGEVLSLSPSSLASLPSCLTYRWEVTPGSAVYSTMNASHTLGAAGTYTIKLTATGSSTRTSSMNVTVTGTGTTPPPPPTGCPTTAPGRYVSIGYTGATSGCTVGAPCQKNEVIAFKAEVTWGGYVFQSCDTFEWNFGDGSAVSRQKDPTHTFTGNGPYTVRLTVTNSKGSVAPEAVVQMAGTGAKKPENVTITLTGTNHRVDAPVTFTATSASEIPVTYSWDFNDGSLAKSGASVTHTFTIAKTYNVSVTASNEGGSAPPKIIPIKIDPSSSFKFLLPAVASLKLGDGSKWLTDVQILNTNPSTQPLDLTFTFNGNGQSATRSITAVTTIYENIVEQLLPPGTFYSGAVTVSGDSPSVPQMWTRTYLASPTGIGTYGHFIPAVPLNTAQSVVTGPSTYFIPGVETSPNFRTNLQIVNPNATSIDITVEAFDEIGIRLGSFTDTVAPFALLQVRDLQVRIPRVADGKPFSLQLSNASGMNMVTYASVIDNKSNDPAYVAGVSALDAGSGAMKQQIVPGVGRIEQASGTWKSDITLFNPDARGIEMNLTYIDGAGARYEAKNLRLPSYGSMRLADVLTSEKFATKPTGATSGIIILDTPTDTGVTKFPIMYDRTYKDRVGQGTFGQGIGSFASAKANVLKDAPAYIIGVRSSSTYKTNVGVVSMAAQGTTIVVFSLFDAGNDNIVREVRLEPGQSVIAQSIVPELLGALDKGSLKVQVLLGGPVWAYASIVDRLTEDPEYVPAVPSK